MPNVLLLKSHHWELLVWSKDISQPRHRLAVSLLKQGQSLPQTSITFCTPTLLTRALSLDVPLVVGSEKSTQLTLESPVFFADIQYEFEMTFKEVDANQEIVKPFITHQSRRINELFHFSCRHNIPTLRGNVNFSDNVGWFCLPIHYFIDGQMEQLSIGFEVFTPHTIVEPVVPERPFAIEYFYPLWSEVLSNEGQHQDHGSLLSAFCYLWLSEFEKLRDRFDYAVVQVLNEPHSLLVGLHEEESATEEAMRPRHGFRTDIKSGSFNRRLQSAQKILSLDTPENRFVKMVLNTVIEKLQSFSQVANLYQQSSPKVPIPDYFEQRLSMWLRPLERLAEHSLFSEVGVFAGLEQHSTVLQQRKGYESIFRHWHLLSLYLDVLGAIASIKIQSIEHLYEVWCFLELKKMVTELGFIELPASKQTLSALDFQLQIDKGFSGSFNFIRDDGIRIRLAHENVFEFQSKSLMDKQQVTPTILLEARYDDGELLHWLFDVSAERDFNDEQVYEHSLGKMQQHLASLKKIYTHPVHSNRADYGVFVLYPQLFMQQRNTNASANPFYDSIVKNHVGAFPMLPKLFLDDDEVVDNNWLFQWLFGRFGIFEFDSGDDFDF